MNQLLTFLKVSLATLSLIVCQFISFCQTCWPTVKSYAFFVWHNIIILSDYIFHSVKNIIAA